MISSLLNTSFYRSIAPWLPPSLFASNVSFYLLTDCSLSFFVCFSFLSLSVFFFFDSSLSLSPVVFSTPWLHHPPAPYLPRFFPSFQSSLPPTFPANSPLFLSGVISLHPPVSQPVSVFDSQSVNQSVSQIYVRKRWTWTQKELQTCTLALAMLCRINSLKLDVIYSRQWIPLKLERPYYKKQTKKKEAGNQSKALIFSQCNHSQTPVFFFKFSK